jgi:uncharacterized membrane protein
MVIQNVYIILFVIVLCQVVVVVVFVAAAADDDDDVATAAFAVWTFAACETFPNNSMCETSVIISEES